MDYPCIKRRKLDSLVVEFTDNNIGRVLFSGDSKYDDGDVIVVNILKAYDLWEDFPMSDSLFDIGNMGIKECDYCGVLNYDDATECYKCEMDFSPLKLKFKSVNDKETLAKFKELNDKETMSEYMNRAESDTHSSHYKKQGIDTFTRAKANMSLEALKGACIFNLDRYLWREKGQNLDDIKKMRDYLDLLEEVESKL